MATKRIVVVGGKSVDFDKLEELAQLQAQLLPSNWPAAKRDGVRLFLALQEMSSQEFKRHLAHNFKNLVKIALEQKDDGEGARVAVSFSLEIDLTAPTVAAIGETKMSFSHKFASKGKAKTMDINQDELLLGDVIDPGSLADENAAAEQAEKDRAEAEAAEAEKAKPKKPKKSGKKEKPEKK